MSKDQRRLGRGLSALLPTDIGARTDEFHSEQTSKTVPQRHALRDIPISEIRPNPLQPRRAFDDAALSRLADSLRTTGTLQPIVVRPTAGGYELVAGERRWRAAKLANLQALPAIIRETSEPEMLELALIENIQREDLNPIERARAYQALKMQFKISNDRISEKLGEDRSTVANYLRLLDLSDDVLALLAAGRISMGHARALLALPDPSQRSALAARIADEGWSVRKVEQRIRDLADRKPPPEPKRPRPAVREVEEALSAALGTQVRIHEGRRKNTGRIVINYYNLDDFDRVTGRLGLAPDPA